MNLTRYQDPAVIRRALSQQVFAVVGMSAKPHRDSHEVGRYLLEAGYTVVPVNPGEQEILGLTCYPTLHDVPVPVSVVDVFRKSDAVPDIARDAVLIGAEYLWLQLGVISEEGVKIATDGGLQCVVDRCTKVEHARYRQALAR